MRFFALAFKRWMRTIWFPLLLVLLVLGLCSASLLASRSGLPAAAVADSDGSKLSASVVNTLAEMGFAVCDDEAQLRGGIARGLYDCGVLLPSGFGENIASGSIEGAVTFLETPDSFVPQLRCDQAAAAIFRERAPFMTADAISEVGLTADGVFEEYEAMTADGNQFSFSVETVDSFAAPSDSRALNYAMGIAVLLGFPAILFAVSRTFSGDTAELAGRLGGRKVCSALILPELGVTLLSLIAACGLGCGLLAVGRSPVSGKLILPLIEWCILVTAFSVAAVSILRRREWIHGLAFFVLLLTPVLCPLAWDAGLLFPPVRFLRCILPTYWLWLCAKHPVIGGICALASLPLTTFLGLRGAERMANGKK